MKKTASEIAEEVLAKVAVSPSMALRALFNRSSEGLYPQQLARLAGKHPKTFARAGAAGSGGGVTPNRQMLIDNGLSKLHINKARVTAPEDMRSIREIANTERYFKNLGA